jgi:hypothetical protein
VRDNQRWTKDVVSPVQKVEKGKVQVAGAQEWVMWNVRSNRFIPQMSKIYRPYTQVPASRSFGSGLGGIR